MALASTKHLRSDVKAKQQQDREIISKPKASTEWGSILTSFTGLKGQALEHRGGVCG